MGFVESQEECKAIENAIVLLRNVQIYLFENFCSRFISFPIEFMAASVLHPGLANIKYLSELERDITKAFLLKEMFTLHESDTTTTATGSNSDRSDDEFDFVSAFGNDCTSNALSNANTNESSDGVEGSAQLKLDCLQEYKMFVQTTKQLAKANTSKRLPCPLAWWKSNCHSFPKLSIVARKWLGCLASSVPSERLFSVSGNIVTPKRATLADSTIRDLVFLHDNGTK